jgi:hypothetical protein
VPKEWNEIDTGRWLFKNRERGGYYVIASTDVSQYNNTWRASGASFRISSVLHHRHTTDEILGEVDVSDDCNLIGRYFYRTDVSTLSYNLWGGCGELGSSFLQLVVEPHDQKYVVKVGAIMRSEADVKAAYRALRSLKPDIGKLNRD